MTADADLIPPPPVVRAKLARSLQEVKTLRTLLRLSIRAAEERHRDNPPEPRQHPAGRDNPSPNGKH
jgi:hypothetical protein